MYMVTRMQKIRLLCPSMFDAHDVGLGSYIGHYSHAFPFSDKSLVTLHCRQGIGKHSYITVVALPTKKRLPFCSPVAPDFCLIAFASGKPFGKAWVGGASRVGALCSDTSMVISFIATVMMLYSIFLPSPRGQIS